VTKKDAVSATLRVDDEVTLHVGPDTRLYWKDGRRASFSEIPAPGSGAPGLILLRYEGTSGQGRVEAEKIELERMLD